MRCDSWRFLSSAESTLEAFRLSNILSGSEPEPLHRPYALENTDLPLCPREPVAALHATQPYPYRYLHRLRGSSHRSIHAGFREFPRRYSRDLEPKELGRGECSMRSTLPAKRCGISGCRRILAQSRPAQSSPTQFGSTSDSNVAL